MAKRIEKKESLHGYRAGHVLRRWEVQRHPVLHAAFYLAPHP